MKKIISVLALSTLVFGSAAAKTSVKVSYKNSGSFWAYNDNGESGTGTYFKQDGKQTAADIGNGYQEKRTNMSFFDLDNISAGDSIAFGASGDYLQYDGKIATTFGNGYKVKVNMLTATWGAFQLKGGWTDGPVVESFRITDDAGAREGAFFESWKLGSIFKNSFAEFSDAQNEIGGTSSRLFTQAGFTLAVPNSDAKLQLKGAVLFPWQWKGSEALATHTDEINNGHLGFTAFAVFNMPKVIKAEAFLKAFAHCDADIDSHAAVYVPGAYLQLLAVPGLTVTFGGSMAVVKYDISDFNFDLRARYAITDQFSLTYMGNISAINDSGFATRHKDGYYTVTAAPHTEYKYNTGAEVATAIGGYKLAESSSKSSSIYTQRAMWNMLGANFKMSDGLVLNLAVAAVTDLANGLDYADQKGEGTTLSITPGVQFNAHKNANFWVGFNVTMQGVGKDLHDVGASKYDSTVTGQGMDLGFAVPFTFKVGF